MDLHDMRLSPLNIQRLQQHQDIQTLKWKAGGDAAPTPKVAEQTVVKQQAQTPVVKQQEQTPVVKQQVQTPSSPTGAGTIGEFAVPGSHVKVLRPYVSPPSHSPKLEEAVQPVSLQVQPKPSAPTRPLTPPPSWNPSSIHSLG